LLLLGRDYQEAADYYIMCVQILDAQPAALHMTADNQQPRHYTPYAVITQV
jgi:hypothetical protein